METLMFNNCNHSKLSLAFSIATIFVIGTAHANSDAEILERIRPLGKVNVKEAIPTPIIPTTKPVKATPTTPPVATAPTPPPKTATTVAQPTAAVAPVKIDIGKKTYESICFACHAVGAANAPKFGDKKIWEPRIAKGIEALLISSVNGTAGGMPPRGGCSACSDADLKAAIEYMISNVK
jgi:cytochrome c5